MAEVAPLCGRMSRFEVGALYTVARLLPLMHDSYFNSVCDCGRCEFITGSLRF